MKSKNRVRKNAATKPAIPQPPSDIPIHLRELENAHNEAIGLLRLFADQLDYIGGPMAPDQRIPVGAALLTDSVAGRLADAHMIIAKAISAELKQL